MSSDFWTWLHLTGDTIDDADLGLIAEARRLVGEAGGGTVTVTAVGPDPEHQFQRLGEYGADRVLHLQSVHLSRYNGDLFAAALMDVFRQHSPTAMLLAHNSQNADLAGRLGAQLDTAVITRVVDAHADGQGPIRALRPISNGYLFETIEATSPTAPLLTFLSATLADPQVIPSAAVDVQVIIPTLEPEALGMQTVEIIAADPETLDIEEADIVIAGGRGVGKDEAFDIIHRVARALGGSVAGTRPVIDLQTLPFERQIGQTGKTVVPQLIVNCGISGANEYTAGIEKSQLVIAINNDSRARIFRFADLGVVGDLHAVLPLLAERLEKITK